MLSRCFLLMIFLSGLFSQMGCARTLGQLVVSSPNRWSLLPGKATLSPMGRQAWGIDQQFRVVVGPPEASLAVSVVEPKRQCRGGRCRGDCAEGNSVKTAGSTKSLASHQPIAPKGTVIILHGIWMKGRWMIRTANMLAEAGYRAVLVDLRGHGVSTGRWLTYGRQEKKDLSQLIDELERRQLIAGELGVYGFSYGAATSIHLAGYDSRIRAVVAVAPFSDMRDVVADFGRTIFPGVERMISDDRIQNAIDSGAEKAKFNPNTDNTLAAMKRTTANVLIIHGTDDWLVPAYHAVRLYEAGRDHAELRLIPRTGHLGIWLFPTEEVGQQTRNWFDRHLVKTF